MYHIYMRYIEVDNNFQNNVSHRMNQNYLYKKELGY